MEELDDDTLIALIKKGDTHAETLFYAKYWVFARNFGRKFASLYTDLGLTADDFSAVAFSSVSTAMKKYVPGKEKSFYGYWLAIAKNECINYVHNNSFIDLNISRPISFDSVSQDNGLTLHETYGSTDSKIMDEITRTQLLDFITASDSKLTDDEKVVAYYMFLHDYNHDELQMLTKWNKKKLYYCVKRARMKVSNFFKSGYFKY